MPESTHTVPTRLESDSMGTVEVPANVYWGAQTARLLIHQTKLTRDGLVTGWTNTMTCRRHRQRVCQALPADVLLTPGTFDQEIALAPLLVARLELSEVLEKTAALLPDISCS